MVSGYGRHVDSMQMGLERVREEMTVPEGRRESVMGEGTRGPRGPREAMEGKLESSSLGMVRAPPPPRQAALFRAGSCPQSWSNGGRVWV